MTASWQKAGYRDAAERYHRIRLVLIWILMANLAVSLGKGVVGYSSGSIGTVAGTDTVIHIEPGR